MATNATHTTKQSRLQTIPNELVESIVEFLPKDDLNSFRSLRLVCRNVNPVATKFFAQRRFRRLRVIPTRIKVQSAIELFANATWGQSVKEVVIVLHGSHLVASEVQAAEDRVKQMRDMKKNFISRKTYKSLFRAREETVTSFQTKFQATYDEDCKQVDVSGLLALFPNMRYLEISNLNGTNIQSKLPWLSFAAAITHSGCKLAILGLKECEITSDDVRHFLSIFPTTKVLSMSGKGNLVDDWAPAICNILVHGQSLKSVYIQKYNTGSAERQRFISRDLDSETSREFQTTLQTSQSYEITRATIRASGDLGVKYACERVGKNLAGDEAFGEMVSKCKEEAELGAMSLGGGPSA